MVSESYLHSSKKVPEEAQLQHGPFFILPMVCQGNLGPLKNRLGTYLLHCSGKTSMLGSGVFLIYHQSTHIIV